MRETKRAAQELSRIAEEYACSNLNGRLLKHARGCAEMAQKLAQRFGLDAERAVTASYLHDIGKQFSREEQAALARKMDMSASEIRSYPPEVLHGPLGALIAKKQLGIDDPEVLQAVEAHSTGCPGMCGLAKVVFVADFIEPSRRFPGASELRSREHATLDKMAAAILKRKLIYLMEKRKVIDARALDFWNELMCGGT